MGIMLYQANPACDAKNIHFLNNSEKYYSELNSYYISSLFNDFYSYTENHFTYNETNIEINPLKKTPTLLLNKIYKLFSGFIFNVYSDEENKGIEYKNAKPAEICLAKYAKAVAEDLNGMSGCYTGVKHALLNTGIIDDYGDMPKGTAKDSIPYFDNNTDKFKQINVKQEDLKKLPAGKIIVYTKDGKSGHVAVTNGKGQEMSDCTDNMMWLEEHKNGSSFKVYELTDNWIYDKSLKKLIFKDKK